MDNLILALASFIRRFFRVYAEGDEFDDSKYCLVETLNENNTKTGFDWGEFHPAYLIQYFHRDAVSWNRNMVSISSVHKPKSFNGLTIPVQIGVVQSVRCFMFGYFEAELLLPESCGQWPAFWLTGGKSWPPEIDIIEAYSRDSNYGDGRFLQSNIHYGDDKHIKASNHFLPKFHAKNYFLKFGMQWERDFVRFYYNGYLVREVTDRKVLDKLNEPMRIVLNSGVEPGYELINDSVVFKNVKVFQRVI